VLRLLRRLAGDRSLPRGVLIRLGLLPVHLAISIDLVPDFVPVLATPTTPHGDGGPSLGGEPRRVGTDPR
jgi:hypothetical protein